MNIPRTEQAFASPDRTIIFFAQKIMKFVIFGTHENVKKFKKNRFLGGRGGCVRAHMWGAS
jgi:hypothetical protein